MNKYKLIKEYPNSPEVGYEIEEKNHWGNWGYFLNCFPIYPEKYPEFWEKVVEQDYEILSFKQTSLQTDLWTKFGDVWGRNMNGACATSPYKYEEILNNPLYVIYSVKRLSDGEIFTVGDIVKQSNIIHNNTFIIRAFEFNINKEHLLVIGNGGINISKIEKLKEVLFKTEDHVAVFKGDIVHLVNSWFEYSSITVGEKTLLLFPNRKMFSTKEKAEEYIIMNKPCLSINDINKPGDIFENNLNTFYIDRLKELVKKRL